MFCFTKIAVVCLLIFKDFAYAVHAKIGDSAAETKLMDDKLLPNHLN